MKEIKAPPLPKAISDYFKALGKKSYKAKVKKMGKAKVAEYMTAMALKRKY